MLFRQKKRNKGPSQLAPKAPARTRGQDRPSWTPRSSPHLRRCRISALYCECRAIAQSSPRHTLLAFAQRTAQCPRHPPQLRRAAAIAPSPSSVAWTRLLRAANADGTQREIPPLNAVTNTCGTFSFTINLSLCIVLDRGGSAGVVGRVRLQIAWNALLLHLVRRRNANLAGRLLTTS